MKGVLTSYSGLTFPLSLIRKGLIVDTFSVISVTDISIEKTLL